MYLYDIQIYLCAQVLSKTIRYTHVIRWAYQSNRIILTQVVQDVSILFFIQTLSLLGPFTPTPICSAIWSNCLYTLLIKNPKLQPNPQLQFFLLNLPGQETYRLGRRLARQVQKKKLKLWIWPKKIFIDLFCPQNIQANRPGCRNSLNFFWKALVYSHFPNLIPSI